MPENESTHMPGEARAPGPTYQETILKDSSQPPAAFLEYSYEFLGDEDIPYENYISREYASAEFKKMWPKVWLLGSRLLMEALLSSL